MGCQWVVRAARGPHVCHHCTPITSVPTEVLHCEQLSSYMAKYLKKSGIKKKSTKNALLCQKNVKKKSTHNNNLYTCNENAKIIEFYCVISYYHVIKIKIMTFLI